MDFFISDDSDENVEKLIVFVGEASLPLPEEANIDAMNQYFNQYNTASARN